MRIKQQYLCRGIYLLITIQQDKPPIRTLYTSPLIEQQRRYAGCDSSYYGRLTLHAHLPQCAPLNQSLLCALFWTVMVLSGRTGETYVLPARRPASSD